MSSFGNSQGGFDQSHGGSRSRRGFGYGRHLTCYFCNKRGHASNVCWSNPDSSNFKPDRNSSNNSRNSKNSTMHESDNGSVKDQSKEIELVASNEGHKQLPTTALNEENDVAEKASDLLDNKITSSLVMPEVDVTEVQNSISNPLDMLDEQGKLHDVGVTVAQCDGVSINGAEQGIKLFGSTPLEPKDENFMTTIMLSKIAENKRRISVEIIETLHQRAENLVEETAAKLTPVKLDEEPGHVEASEVKEPQLVDHDASLDSSHKIMDPTIDENDHSSEKDQAKEVEDGSEQLSTTALNEENQATEKASDSLNNKVPSSPTLKMPEVAATEAHCSVLKSVDNVDDPEKLHNDDVIPTATYCNPISANGTAHEIKLSTQLESKEENSLTEQESKQVEANEVKVPQAGDNRDVKSKKHSHKKLIKMTESDWEALKSGYDKRIQDLDDKINRVNDMTRTLCEKNKRLSSINNKLINQGINPDLIETTSHANKTTNQQMFEPSKHLHPFAASANYMAPNPFGLSSHNAFSSSAYGIPQPLGYPMVPPNTPVMMPTYPPAMMYPFGMGYGHGLSMQGYGYQAPQPFDPTVNKMSHPSASASTGNDGDNDQEAN